MTECRASACPQGVEAERAWEQQLADYERLLLPATGHVDLVVFNFFALHVAHLCEARGLPGVALWQAPATPTGARPHFLVRGKLAAACRQSCNRSSTFSRADTSSNSLAHSPADLSGESTGRCCHHSWRGLLSRDLLRRHGPKQCNCIIRWLVPNLCGLLC